MVAKSQKTKALIVVFMAVAIALSGGFLERGLAEDNSSKEGLPGRREGGGTRGYYTIFNLLAPSPFLKS